MLSAVEGLKLVAPALALDEVHRHYEYVKDINLVEELRDTFYLNALDIHKRDREFKSHPLWKRLLIALRYLLS